MYHFNFLLNIIYNYALILYICFILEYSFNIIIKNIINIINNINNMKDRRSGSKTWNTGWLNPVNVKEGVEIVGLCGVDAASRVD